MQACRLLHTIYGSCRERELMGHYLTLLASLEHHCHIARNHQHTLDELIDLVDFTKT